MFPNADRENGWPPLRLATNTFRQDEGAVNYPASEQPRPQPSQQPPLASNGVGPSTACTTLNHTPHTQTYTVTCVYIQYVCVCHWNEGGGLWIKHLGSSPWTHHLNKSDLTKTCTVINNSMVTLGISRDWAQQTYVTLQHSNCATGRTLTGLMLWSWRA